MLHLAPKYKLSSQDVRLTWPKDAPACPSHSHSPDQFCLAFWSVLVRKPKCEGGWWCSHLTWLPQKLKL